MLQNMQLIWPINKEKLEIAKLFGCEMVYVLSLMLKIPWM